MEYDPPPSDWPSGKPVFPLSRIGSKGTTFCPFLYCRRVVMAQQAGRQLPPRSVFGGRSKR